MRLPSARRRRGDDSRDESRDGFSWVDLADANPARNALRSIRQVCRGCSCGGARGQVGGRGVVAFGLSAREVDIAVGRPLLLLRKASAYFAQAELDRPFKR